MKDAAHHLKRIQKKIMQESRKSSGGVKPFAKQEISNTSFALESSTAVRYEKSIGINNVQRLRNARNLSINI